MDFERLWSVLMVGSVLSRRKGMNWLAVLFVPAVSAPGRQKQRQQHDTVDCTGGPCLGSQEDEIEKTGPVFVRKSPQLLSAAAFV